MTLSRRLLPTLFEGETEHLTAVMDDAAAICATTDHWTSRRGQGYLTVTTHFITSDWKLHCHVLDTPRMTGSVTGQYTGETLDNCFVKWGIMPRVYGVVADGAPVMTCAIRSIDKYRVQCFAHNLNLIVQATLISPDAGVDAARTKVKKNGFPLQTKHEVKRQTGAPSEKCWNQRSA